MMKKTFLITLATLFASIAFGQDISVTFTGTGAATTIDSVKVTNLTTNMSITLPGNETLILTNKTGISGGSEISNCGIVYPNPFSGKAIVAISVIKPQSVYLKIQNMVGQLISESRTWVQSGNHEFDIFLNTPGIYMVTQKTEQGTVSYKVICGDATGLDNIIRYRGISSNLVANSGLKTRQSGFSLGYSAGEIILYNCFSGSYTTVVTDSPVEPKNYEIDFESCTDPDGNNYPIVNIGEDTWMAENLKSSHYRNGDEIQNVVDGLAWSNLNTGAYCWYFPNDPTKRNIYGALYNWFAVKDIRNLCPVGWHPATNAEWITLSGFLGGSANAGGKLKSSGTIENGTGLWSSPNTNATNESGFSAIPGGGRYPGNFFDNGYSSFWWTITENDEINAIGQSVSYESNALLNDVFRKNSGFSVRCVKNLYVESSPKVTTSAVKRLSRNTVQTGGNVISDGGLVVTGRGVCWSINPDPTILNDKTADGIGMGSFISTLTDLSEKTTYYVKAYATNSLGTSYGEQQQFTTDGTFDYEGHTYAYITIGSQVWMAENLAILPSVSPSTVGSDTNPVYYVYGYEGTDVNAAKNTANYKTYGVLYNWEAAKLVCPTGWHTPSLDDWTTLTNYLGGINSAGKLREVGFSHWDAPNIAATNESGFTALPGGNRGEAGLYWSIRSNATFWTTTPFSASLVNAIGLFGTSERVNLGIGYKKNLGHSVRCVKD